jgi:uncharacterized delta-60 repeat protein
MSMQKWWDSALVRVKSIGREPLTRVSPTRTNSRTCAPRRLFAEQLEDRRVLTGLPPTISLPGGGGTGWSLDSTFGGDGRVTETVAEISSDSINALAVQSDGKIVAVGSTESMGEVDFFAARFLPDGSLDGTFGTGGIVTYDFGGLDVATSVALDSSGRIIVGGQRNADQLAIAWIDPADGSVAQTFLSFLPGTLGGAQLEGLAIDSNDNAVVVGTTSNFSDWFVARITPAGAFDSSFDGVGARHVDIGNNFEAATDVLITPDADIVVGGWTAFEDEFTVVNSYAAVRLDSSGALDEAGFGTEGIALAAINGEAQGIGRLSDGSIVLAGWVFGDTSIDIGVAKFSDSGAVEFALTTDFADGDDYGFDLAVQDDDKIVVAGSIVDPLLPSGEDFLLARYNSDGSLDESLAAGGYLQTDFGSTSDTAFAVAIQSDGKIVLGGSDGSSDLALARFAPATGEPESFDLDEGESFTLTGSYTDPDGTNPPTIMIDWGDGKPATAATLDEVNLTFSATYAYGDNTPTPAPFVIVATITDDQENQASVETTAAVANVAPEAGPITGPAGGVRYQSLGFAGAFSDAGFDDTHEIRWDFGDGSFIDFTASNASGALEPQHFYTSAGEYEVTLTVRDDEGAVHAVSTTVEIVAAQLQTAPCGCGEALYVGGTAAADNIVISAAGGGTMQVTIDNVAIGTFAPTHGVVVFAGDGNDDVSVSAAITQSAWLYGGDGDDRLKGGSGANVLLGGSGDDLLVGGSNRDVLIGGVGADRIIGNGQDDLLIAGYTDHDDNPEALCHILAEWVSNKLYYVRVLNLTGLLPLIDPQNGDFFLNSSTVHDDGEQDLLTGSSGFDWFFANLCLDDDSPVKDKITDRSFWEIALDIDFIES